MAFNAEQKRLWSKKPEVRARQREHDAKHEAKKRSLGIPQHLPINPGLRARAIAASADRAAAGRERALAYNEKRKDEARLRKPARLNREAAKNRRHRAKLRDMAIRAFGGACQWCGYDVAMVLQFDHVEPLRRRFNGIKTKDLTLGVYRQIIKGECLDKFQLLCANCHVIKTRTEDDYDGQLCLNIAHREEKALSPLPLFCNGL